MEAFFQSSIDSTKRARPEGLDGLFRFGVKNRALLKDSDRHATLVQALQHRHNVRPQVSLNSHLRTHTAGIENGHNSFEFQLSSDRPLLGKWKGEIATTRETIISRAGREAGTDIRAILGAINPQTDSESSSSPFRLGRHMAVGCHNRGKSNLVFPWLQVEHVSNVLIRRPNRQLPIFIPGPHSVTLLNARGEYPRDNSGIALHSNTHWSL